MDFPPVCGTLTLEPQHLTGNYVQPSLMLPGIAYVRFPVQISDIVRFSITYLAGRQGNRQMANPETLRA